jgi:hypothetical protein
MKNLKQKTNLVILGLTCAILSGCAEKVYTANAQNGAPGQSGTDGSNGASCLASPVAGGIDITCGTNPPIFLANGQNGSNGQNGAVGATGSAGAAGASCAATIVSGGVSIKCGTNAAIFLANGVNGTNGSNGTNGTNGQNGAAGATGATGAAGASCSAVAVSGGVNMICGSSAPVFIASTASQINPGIMCTAYSILAKDYGTSANSVNWAQLFNDGTEQFSTMLTNFNVGNQVDTILFPGLTQAEQTLIGQANWALDCYGFLNVPETGGYTFQLSSDDGSQLVINNNVLINMAQAQPYSVGTSSQVTLFAGPQQINVLYFQGPQTNEGLTLKWQGPTSAGLSVMSVVPASAFTYQVE